MTRETLGFDIVAVGTSAGGFAALCKLIGALPSDFELPLAIVQHRARESDALAELLQDCTTLRVIDIEDKLPVEPATIYIAPPDYHTLIDDHRFALSIDGPVGFSRPSIDVFFESVADAYGPRAIGVILTGANADGSRGLREIVNRGGQALVQDPATAEVGVMPASAARLVTRAHILPLDEIAARLQQLENRQRRWNSGQVRS